MRKGSAEKSVRSCTLRRSSTILHLGEGVRSLNHTVTHRVGSPGLTFLGWVAFSFPLSKSAEVIGTVGKRCPLGQVFSASIVLHDFVM
jgi:hypothetical protein